MKHTETPWEARVTGSYTAPRIFKVKGASGVTAAEAYGEENAAHIVHCVNAHDGLVAALRAVVGCYWDDEEKAMRTDAPLYARKALAALRAAGEEV